MRSDISQQLAGFALAVGVSLAAGVASYPALRRHRRTRLVTLALAAAVIVAAPFLIPHGARLLRLLAAVQSVTLLVKLFDLHIGAARGAVPTFPAFLAFLPNIFCLVHRKLAAVRRPTTRENLRALALATPVTAAMTGVLIFLFLVDWSRHPFALEHAAKVVTLFLVIVPLTAVVGAAWNLLGGRGLAFMDNPFAARTPADFWRRYNRPVRQFLQEDVFLPAGGRRHPVRGALVVFLVSAAVHEYVFDAATGRIDGHQTAFFLVQGIAVAATLRLKPRGPAAAVAVAATFAFNLATAVLFFASVDRVLPAFYTSASPAAANSWRGG